MAETLRELVVALSPELKPSGRAPQPGREAGGVFPKRERAAGLFFREISRLLPG